MKLLLYAILLIEFLFSLIIIYKVGYTEIDFSTYMQQVELFLLGERDYFMTQYAKQEDG